MSGFTLIDDERVAGADRTPAGASRVDARRDGDRILLPATELERALGWSLEEQGICRGDVCIPVRDRSSLVGQGGAVDLAAFADLLGRPFAMDHEEGIALLGTAAEERGRSLASLEAPDFELPDLSGQVHRLSDQRGKKVLLIAYASW